MGLLTLSFLFHWWIGTMTYLGLPVRNFLKPKLTYPLYILILTAMTIGTLLFYNVTIFFITYSLSFIFVIPLYREMLESGRLDGGIKKFVKFKYFLEYIGGLGFLLTALVSYLLPQTTTALVITCLLVHLYILNILFKPKYYPNIIKELNIKFL